jgi:pentalenene oxygenase
LNKLPGVQERLYAELHETLGDREVTAADLPRLPYLWRVVTESLRINTPSWLLSRIASADTTLGGFKIPRGANILYSFYCLNRMEDYYDSPVAFDPDRWLPERTDRRQRDAYFPFGAGTRKCIGDSYAFTELSLTLAAVVKRWRLTPVPDTNMKPILRVSLSPSVLSMVVNRRDAAGAAHTSLFSSSSRLPDGGEPTGQRSLRGVRCRVRCGVAFAGMAGR